MFSKIFYSWTLNKRTFKRFTSVKRKMNTKNKQDARSNSEQRMENILVKLNKHLL